MMNQKTNRTDCITLTVSTFEMSERDKTLTKLFQRYSCTVFVSNTTFLRDIEQAKWLGGKSLAVCWYWLRPMPDQRKFRNYKFPNCICQESNPRLKTTVRFAREVVKSPFKLGPRERKVLQRAQKAIIQEKRVTDNSHFTFQLTCWLSRTHPIVHNGAEDNGSVRASVSSALVIGGNPPSPLISTMIDTEIRCNGESFAINYLSLFRRTPIKSDGIPQKRW
ncbi:jg6127 [Pararge aegeria aegeria]|uniref:Jg6127 protein n=1 Tax=Pararge aegeria aegeria TaxID=348720 RepID=A0A8S4RBH0_9NEOP|nr:jg6127 [Pararge aegeria aegeria]